MRHITPPDEDEISSFDQRTTLRGIRWEEFEAVVAMRGDQAGPRLAYLDGELEFMSPSEFHEGIKTTWARLLEAWSEEQEIELEGRGNWTLKTAPRRKAGIEPDECYFVGARGRKKVPDLALEVVWTDGGLDKLEIYRRLGVREVWLWSDGQIQVHVLGRNGYARRSTSAVLPAMDFALLLECLKEPTQTRAIKKLRAAMHAERWDA